MPAVTGRQLAYQTQRITAQAILDLQASPEPMTAAKALALSALVTALDRIQERLRKHQGRHRKHRAKPKASSDVAKSSMPRVGQASSVPVPSQTQVGSGSDSEPDPNS
jgi:hypothetical protein